MMPAALALVYDADAVEVAAAPEFWVTAQAIADMKLPGISRSKRKVNELADSEGWAFRVDGHGLPLARSRRARGGGVEYRIDVLPPAARARALSLLTGEAATPAPAATQERSLWAEFEGASDAIKAVAKRRVGIIDSIEAAEGSGMTANAAVADAAARYAVSPATIWNWRREIKGLDANDRLPALAPKRRGGGRECEVDPDIWRSLISDYLRPEEPTWERCYWQASRSAKAQGIAIPPSRTLRRKFDREVDPLVVTRMRKGRDAHALTLPPQIRTVKGLSALEIVNIDGHRWDVFVKFPCGKVARPITVAIQDVMSRKMLAWRHDDSENAITTRLAFADLFRNFGIPKACLLDNGRAFASKAITGGAKTRYRFKIKPDDPTGLLPSLGINPKWATPYHGQAKPIERQFKDYCDQIARHAAFAGAYTGGNPNAKPENYGSRAIDWADFVTLVDQEIAALNAKDGRKTEMARGRSFDAAFNESYAVSPITKATPEQLRLALLTADGTIRTHRTDGSIRIAGNVYWSEALSRHPATAVTVRFDPDNLHSEIHVYTRDDRFIATAGIWEAAGFADMAAAGKMRKLRKAHRDATKAEQAALDLMSAAELAEFQRGLRADLDETPEPQVVRPARHSRTAAALKSAPKPSLNPLSRPAQDDAIDRLVAITERRLRIVE